MIEEDIEYVRTLLQKRGVKDAFKEADAPLLRTLLVEMETLEEKYELLNNSFETMNRERSEALSKVDPLLQSLRAVERERASILSEVSELRKTSRQLFREKESLQKTWTEEVALMSFQRGEMESKIRNLELDNEKLRKTLEASLEGSLTTVTVEEGKRHVRKPVLEIHPAPLSNRDYEEATPRSETEGAASHSLTALQVIEAEKAKLESHLKAALEEVSQYKTQLEDVSAEKDEMHREIERLRERIGEAFPSTPRESSSSGVSNVKFDVLMKEYSRCQQELEALSETNTRLEEELQRIGEIERERDEAITQSTALLEELKKVHEHTQTKLHEGRNTPPSHRTKADEEVEATMREELEQLRTRCKELESRAAGRDTSVDEETVARFSREMEQASSRANALSAEVASLHVKLSEAEHTSRRFLRQRETDKKEIEESKQREKNVFNRFKEMEARLEAQIRERKDMQEMLAAAEARERTALADAEELRAMFVRSERGTTTQSDEDLAELKRSLKQAKLERLEATEAAKVAQTEIESLQSDLASYKRREVLFEQRSNALQKEVEELRALCERKEEEIDQLKALAKAVDEGRERVVTALRERIADVSKKDAELERLRECLREEAQRTAAAQAETETAKKALAFLDNECDQVQAELDNACERLSQKSEDMRRMEEREGKARDEVESKEAMMQELKTELTAVRSKCSTLEAQILELEEGRKSTSEILSTLSEENEALKSDVVVMTKEAQGLSAELNRTVDALEVQKDETAEMKRAALAARQLAASIETERDELQRSLKERDVEARDVERKLSDAQEKMMLERQRATSLLEELRRTREALEDAELSRDAAIRDVQHLEGQCSGLAASLSATEKRVEIAERGRREAQTNWEAAQAATERLRGESLSTRTASAAEVHARKSLEEALHREQASARLQAEELRDARARLLDLESVVEGLRKRLAESSRTESSLRSEIESAQLSSRRKAEDSRLQEARLEEMEKRFQEATERADAAESRVRELASSATVTSHSLKERESASERVTTESRRLIQDNSHLEDQLARLMAERDSLRNALEKERRRAEEADSEKYRALARVDELERQMKTPSPAAQSPESPVVQHRPEVEQSGRRTRSSPEVERALRLELLRVTGEMDQLHALLREARTQADVWKAKAEEAAFERSGSESYEEWSGQEEALGLNISMFSESSQ